MKKRAIVTRRWPKAVEDIISSAFDATLNVSDQPLSQTELRAAFLDYDVVFATVSDAVPASIFPTAPRARLIANYGVGFSHIDLDAARNLGIAVTNTPGVLTDCTADIAMNLLLTAARRTGEGERQVRSGEWKGWCPTHMVGTKVTGKTLGIIGMGRIGRALARRAHLGFDMKIVFYDQMSVGESDAAALGAKQLGSIEEVLAIADFVSLHCPGGSENRHLMNATRLTMMKPTAHLINTARGDVIDVDALVAALQAGTIAGAGLDVYPDEPSIPSALLKLENVALFPHLGSATNETREAMGMTALENAIAFFDGRPLPNRVV